MSQSGEIKRILFQYDLVPMALTEISCVIKAETTAGTFALKYKKLKDEQISRLKTVYSLIRSLRMDGVAPLPSKYGDLVIKGENACFYLMPWFQETVPDSDLAERYLYLFLKAGQLHRQTMGKEQDASQLIQSLIRLIQQKQLIWERLITTAEHRTYPSPFEQIILACGAKVMGALQQALIYFSQKVADEDHAGKLRKALCHGRLNPLHLLIEQEKSVLINFEESREDFFIIETAALFEQASMMLPNQGAPWPKLLQAYFSACPLDDDETAFLYHLLLFPKPVFDLVEQYTYQKNEQILTKQLVDCVRSYERLIREIGAWIQKQKKEREAEEKKEQEKKEANES